MKKTDMFFWLGDEADTDFVKVVDKETFLEYIKNEEERINAKRDDDGQDGGCDREDCTYPNC